jgi:hypothetical protein
MAEEFDPFAAPAGPIPADFNAEEAENLDDIEKQFAVKGKLQPLLFSSPLPSLALPVMYIFWLTLCLSTTSTAVQQMQTYWSLLSKIRGSQLRLTKMDDEIYTHLQLVFPEFDPAAPVDEDAMKSAAGKAKWRDFINKYENLVADYNFGTLVRRAPSMEYGEKETMFVTRMHFYAIEIARNKKGLNDWVYEEAHALENGEQKKTTDS